MQGALPSSAHSQVQAELDLDLLSSIERLQKLRGRLPEIKPRKVYSSRTHTTC